MEISVLSREMARKRIPDKPELLIGILDSKPFTNVPIVPVKSMLRADYLTYVFDDIAATYQDYVLIDEDIAGRILEDFSRFKGKIESLAVHCRAGLSRSPAVAAALNDCFSLGNSSEEFFNGGYPPNMFVYRTIIRAAIERGMSVRSIQR